MELLTDLQRDILDHSVHLSHFLPSMCSRSFREKGYAHYENHRCQFCLTLFFSPLLPEGQSVSRDYYRYWHDQDINNKHPVKVRARPESQQQVNQEKADAGDTRCLVDHIVQVYNRGHYYKSYSGLTNNTPDVTRIANSKHRYKESIQRYCC